MTPHDETGYTVGTELANAVRENPMNGDGANGAVSALLSKLRHLPGVQEGYNARTAERAEQRQAMYDRLEAQNAARRRAALPFDPPLCPTCGGRTTGIETFEPGHPKLIPCGHVAKVTLSEDPAVAPILELP